MEILANIGLIVAVVAAAYVFCMFLRWFLGIQRLEEKLNEVLSELRSLRGEERNKRDDMIGFYRELKKDDRSGEGSDQR